MVKIELRKMDILVEAEAKGRVRGEIRGEKNGALSVLNALSKDPNCGYTVEELAENFGFTVDEIVNWK